MMKSIIDNLNTFDRRNPQNLHDLNKALSERLISNDSPNQFYELNNFVAEALSLNQQIVMIDMPEILYRMKLGNDYTL